MTPEILETIASRFNDLLALLRLEGELSEDEEIELLEGFAISRAVRPEHAHLFPADAEGELQGYFFEGFDISFEENPGVLTRFETHSRLLQQLLAHEALQVLAVDVALRDSLCAAIDRLPGCHGRQWASELASHIDVHCSMNNAGRWEGSGTRQLIRRAMRVCL